MSDIDIVVRDFIYVDADRLYSLYSQVFEGVADQIVESVIAELTTTDSQKGPILQGSNTEAQVAEASRRTENKSLYDHMYNRLEERLDSVVTNAVEVTQENYRSKLSQAFMIRVSGQAEIEDYARMSMFMERFNDLADAIGYSQLMGVRKTFENSWQEKENTINQIKDKNQKSRAKKELNREKKEFEKSAEDYLKKTGLRQDENMLSNLRLFIEIFNPKGFDITLNPSEDEQSIVYRGVLDKKWLRVQPDFLRSLYGSAVNSKWTMVGKVTYIPQQEISSFREITKELLDGAKSEKTDENEEIESVEVAGLDEQPEQENDQGVIGNNNPSMRDPFRNMFGSARAFDQMFLESEQRIEILVAPLAIYHEISIPQRLETPDEQG